MRHFYTHHISRSGLKRIPTALDFEKYRDDKARECFKGRLKIKSTILQCKNAVSHAANSGAFTCATAAAILGATTLASLGTAAPIAATIIAGTCGGYMLFQGEQAKVGCEIGGDIAKARYNKKNGCKP